ncbi:MAG: 50S ribosomal protein L25 [SAR202 cluster bacterium]|nr:50S ribosomal protein L25 [SAR202 cluster bacterium]
MAQMQSLRLSPREVTGKKVKQLRLNGITPVHLYGGSADSASLQVQESDLRRLLSNVGGNVPITVEVEGTEGENICFVREVQRHPVSEQVIHVDFLRVDADQIVTAEVPIILDDDAPAVRNLGGTLAQPLQSLRVEALPLDMPASLHISVSSLEGFEDAVRVGDLVLGEGVTTSIGSNEMIARVMQPRLEEEVEEEEVLEEGDLVESEDGEEIPEDDSEEGN